MIQMKRNRLREDQRADTGATGLKSTLGHRLVRGLLIAMIGSLVAAGLLAAGILLFGRFGEVQGKIIGTTFLFGIFSFVGLAASLRIERRRLAWLGTAGIVASSVALVLSVFLIWGEIGDSGWGRAFGGSSVLAAAIGYASVLMLVRPESPAVRWVLTATFGLLVAVTAMLEYVVLRAPETFEEADLFFRLLGAMAILLAIGTFVTPILNRVVRRHPT
jgi:MFS family permease